MRPFFRIDDKVEFLMLDNNDSSQHTGVITDIHVNKIGVVYMVSLSDTEQTLPILQEQILHRIE